MDFDIDRDPNKQPSLPEMTQKALDLMSAPEKGLFLVVEGKSSVVDI